MRANGTAKEEQNCLLTLVMTVTPIGLRGHVVELRQIMPHGLLLLVDDLLLQEVHHSSGHNMLPRLEQ